MAQEFTPYSTAVPLFGKKPDWITDPLDIQRVQAYEVYERIYWTAPDVYAVQMRGSDGLPTYAPTARTVIETINRYLVPDLTIHIANLEDPGADATPDVLAARFALSDLLVREQFMAKFAGAKRFGVIHGDWVWYITANEAKEVGKRISITALDPSMYFKVTDPDDVTRIIGVKLAQPVIEEDETKVRVQIYRKDTTKTPTEITVEEGIYNVEDWESPDAKPIRVIRAVTALPPQITAIPVYHIKHFDEPGNPYGSSEVRGFERHFSDMSQILSDEGLALALEGVGAYETDAPTPRDKNGNEINWKVGPGQVLHHPPGTKFGRVSGVTNVQAFGDHYDRVQDSVLRAASAPDIAVGKVDVQVAQSGIALALELSPILAKAREKNELALGVLEQMFYDIFTMWYPAYEQTTFEGILITCDPGEAIPVDRETRRDELNDMFDRKVISTQYYRSEMEKMGYIFPTDIEEQIAADSQASAASADATANRLLAEAGA